MPPPDSEFWVFLCFAAGAIAIIAAVGGLIYGFFFQHPL